MPRVRQVQPLSMGWCLDCHREPAANLRDPALVTKMDAVEPAKVEVLGVGKVKANGRTLQPPTHCSGCHR
jgi:hypothetical protein